METFQVYQLNGTTGAEHWVCTSGCLQSGINWTTLVQDSSGDFVLSNHGASLQAKGHSCNHPMAVTSGYDDLVVSISRAQSSY